jgi:hypothetical protein
MKKILLLIAVFFTLFFFRKVVNAQNWYSANAPGTVYKPALFVSSVFNNDLLVAGSNSIQRWDGYNWITMNNSGVVIDTVKAFAELNNVVYAAGHLYPSSGSYADNYVYKWNGTNWVTVGANFHNMIHSLCVYNGSLYAAGYFRIAWGGPGDFIVRWDGANWVSVGGGIGGTGYSLAVYNSRLIVGGVFTLAGTTTANHIASWDGNNWYALGSGFNYECYALTVNSSNNLLYAGGLFSMAGGGNAKHIASWNGTTWSCLGPLGSDGLNGNVYTLAIHNNELYAGGIFTTTGASVPVNNISKWSVTSWLPLGTGTVGTNNWVTSIVSYNTNLCVGGSFTSAGGIPLNFFAVYGISNNLTVNTKIFLQGAYISNGQMSTTLRSLSLIPLTQPYSGTPWWYGGTESVTSIPPNVTDWVLVELRTGTPLSSRVSIKAGFIKNTGEIVDVNGTSPLSFSTVFPGNYYIVIWHRNHLVVMSKLPQYLNPTSILYDFTTGLIKYYGGNLSYPAAAGLGTVFGMWGGNAYNKDKTVKRMNFMSDYNEIGTTLSNVYDRRDINMNGQVTIYGSGSDISFLLTIVPIWFISRISWVP